MKLTVLQEEFAKALNICSRFTSSKLQLPILSNVLLKSSKNNLTLMATNLELSISYSLGAKVEVEGAIAVPGKELTEIFSNIGAGQITLEAETEKLRVKSEGFESEILGINASEFPQVPQSIGLKFLEIPKEKFFEAVRQLVFAISNDETRPQLTGIYFSVKDGFLTMVSTDGFRLSKKKIKIKGETEVENLILPKSIFLELLRFTEEETFFKFSINSREKQAVFSINDAIISSRLIEGNFPDYERIIPSQAKIRILVDKQEFLRRVKLASTFARDSANIVKISINKDFLEIFSESNRLGTQHSNLDAKIEGDLAEEEKTIAFNFRFLEDFLSALESEEIRIEITSPNSPALFVDPNLEDFIHIIMPIKINT